MLQKCLQCCVGFLSPRFHPFMQIVGSLVKLGISGTCYGAVSPLSPGLTRAANIPEGTPTCLGNCRWIEREDNHCSSPLLEKHSKKLTDIPASFYAVLNSWGENKENYCPGSKWCHACKRKFYKEASLMF